MPRSLHSKPLGHALHSEDFNSSVNVPGEHYDESTDPKLPVKDPAGASYGYAV